MTTSPTESVALLLGTSRQDPLNRPADESTCWTTVNTGEIFSVMPTPMTWTFCAPAFEAGSRYSFYQMGVLKHSEVPIPPDSADRFVDIFQGVVAANVTSFRLVCDRLPGTSGDAFETAYFGAVESGLTSKSTKRRYPIIFLRLPITKFRAPRMVRAEVVDTKRWWAQSIAEPAGSLADLTASLHQAYERMGRILRGHAMVTYLAQPAYEQLRVLVHTAGLPSTATTSLVWTGETEEFGTVSDLWDVARGQRTIEDFIAVHGYHGPAEAELSSQVWREDPRPLESLVAAYRGLDKDASPAGQRDQFARERDDAERKLMTSVSARGRRKARSALRLARTLMPLRETGRASMLMALDVARLRARQIGTELATRGVLADAEDVFYLCADELDPPPANARDLIHERRAARAKYQAQTLPSFWRGAAMPSASPPADDSGPTTTTLRGIGASGGQVEGIARVVLSNGDSELEPDEILICHTTDPSWAAYLFLSAGAVIDVGSTLSHGAIVARELGIPCVINVRDATRLIKSGMRIRIDGDTGEVNILD